MGFLYTVVVLVIGLEFCGSFTVVALLYETNSVLLSLLCLYLIVAQTTTINVIITSKEDDPSFSTCRRVLLFLCSIGIMLNGSLVVWLIVFS